MRRKTGRLARTRPDTHTHHIGGGDRQEASCPKAPLSKSDLDRSISYDFSTDTPAFSSFLLALCRECSQLSIDTPFAYFCAYLLISTTTQLPSCELTRPDSLQCSLFSATIIIDNIYTSFTRMLPVSTGPDAHSHLPHSTPATNIFQLSPWLFAAEHILWDSMLFSDC